MVRTSFNSAISRKAGRRGAEYGKMAGANEP